MNLLTYAQTYGLSIELFLTRKCNYFCGHCMYECGPQESKDYMSDEVLAKVKKQVDFLKKLGIHSFVNLIGGEPTINLKKFQHILDEVETWDASITMTTNGWFLHSQKFTEKFLEIVSKYVDREGKSNFCRGKKAFNIRVSNGPFHEKSRNGINITEALNRIFSNEELIKKYDTPIPDKDDPWIWDQGFDKDRYYISPNGRGKNVTNLQEWLENKTVDGKNMCLREHGLESIHYELDGSISDTCGLGSFYDFGTVDDNILFIIILIREYKNQRWENKETINYHCGNCRSMVQSWKENNLEKYRGHYAFMNNFSLEEYKKIFKIACDLTTING